MAKAFGFGHPLWERALKMRRDEQATAYEILKVLHEEGFTNVTYRQVTYGLRSAPQAAMLPTRTSSYLRQRFERASKDFNSYVAMRDLAQEALEKIAELEEEIASPETAPLREQFLRSELSRWYDKAFQWSQACSDVALRLDERGLKGEYLDGRRIGPPIDAQDGEYRELDQTQETERERRARIDAEQAALMEEFTKKLPPPPVETIVKQYGGNNVKVPSENDDEEDDDDGEVI